MTEKIKAWGFQPGGVIVRVLLIITAFAIFVPISPKMPAGGLDPSWMHATNYATANGFIFGQDYIFSMGPLAGVFTTVYHPDTDLIVILASSLLGGSYAYMLWAVSAGRPRYVLVLALVAIAGLVYSRDALLFSYALLSVLFFSTRGMVNYFSSPKLYSIALWLITAPLGLLPLIKGSFIPVAVIAALVIGGLAWRGRKRHFLIATISPLSLLILFWILLAQPIPALYGYFAGVGEVISGYSDAMSIEDSPIDIYGYLFSAGFLLAAVSREGATKNRLLVFFTALLLFVVFKASFVRHDSHHVFVGSSFLVLASVFFILAIDRLSLRIAFAIALLFWVFVDVTRMNSSPGTVAASIARVYVQSLDGLAKRLFLNRFLEKKYDKAIIAIAGEQPIPFIAGTADIYSFNQSALLASGNRWSPRPGIQSYASYTTKLASLDVEHLIGPRAPENIIWSHETIDGRFPTLDVGASLPIILRNYAPINSVGGFLVLSRPLVITAPSMKVVNSQTVRIGEKLYVPEGGGRIFVKIKMRKTIFGDALTAIYKIDPVFVSVMLSNGSMRRYRLIPEMAKSGFLLSPLIEDNNDLKALYVTPSDLTDKQVVSIQVDTAGAIAWHRDFEVEFFDLNIS